MPNAGQVITALYGAFRLFRFDPSGFRYFDTTIDGFWRSFFCAVLILPLYIALIVMRMDATELASPLFRIVLIEAIQYVTAWVSFPLVMFYLTQTFDRGERYLGYVVAYNWCSAPQVVFMCAVELLRQADILPEPVETGLQVGAVLYVMSVQWYIARQALEVGPIVAIAVVALDFTISLMLGIVSHSMLTPRGGI